MDRYFAYCPEDGFETFDTIEARDEWAKKSIDLHLDDGWSEYVDQVCVGEITAWATKTNERPQPKREEFATEEEYDDAISDWGGDTSYDSICNYELLPIGAGADPHVKSPLPAQAGGGPVTPSALESGLAKLRECADKTMFAEVTHEEAATLLARLDAADRLAQCVYALSDPADELCGVYPGPERDELKEALATYRNQRPAGGGE